MRSSVPYFELMFFSFLQLFGYSMATPFLPILASELDPTGLLVGVVVGSHFLSRIFIELPSGLIIDKFGERKPILLSFLLSTIGAIICAFSMSIYMLILGFMVWGLGSAFFFTSSTVFVITSFELRERGRALGTLQAVGFAGIFVGASAGGFLAEFLGYESVFLISGALMVVGFLMTLLSDSLKEQPERRLIRVSIVDSLKELKNLGLFVICVASLFRMYITQGVISTSFPIYLHDFLNMSAGLIGISIGLRTFGLSIGTVVFGQIADKRGRKSVALIGLTVESLCLYLFTSAGSFVILFPLAFLEGLAAGMVSVALILLVSERKSQYKGGAIGLYRTFMDIGAVTGPIATMTIYTTFGANVSFISSAILLLINILTMATLRSAQ